LSELVRQHEMAGDKDRVITTLAELVGRQKALLGPGHPDTMQSMDGLGRSYGNMGRFDESVPVLEELLKIREAKLGRDHEDTLQTVADLGRAHLNAGRPREAIPLLEEAAAAAQKHPRLGWARARLPEAYAKAGERAKLDAVIRDLRAKFRAGSPADDPGLA